MLADTEAKKKTQRHYGSHWSAGHVLHLTASGPYRVDQSPGTSTCIKRRHERCMKLFYVPQAIWNSSILSGHGGVQHQRSVGAAVRTGGSTENQLELQDPRVSHPARSPRMLDVGRRGRCLSFPARLSLLLMKTLRGCPLAVCPG